MDLNDNTDGFDDFFNTKKSTTLSQQKSSKNTDPMEDLFGLDEKAEKGTNIIRKSYTAATKPTSKIKVQDEDDDDLGFDPKKPKAPGKSQNLFDDLLSPQETKKPQTSVGSTTKTTISRQSTDTTTDTSNVFQSQAIRPKTSQSRRTANMGSGKIPDPLGLFSTGKDISKPSSRAASPKARATATTADWLGLSKESENKTVITEANLEASKTTEVLKTPHDKTEEAAGSKTEEPQKEQEQEKEEAQLIDSVSHHFNLINTLNLEAEQGFSALKYQEQQLFMASQMKQQERVLMNMQLKQDSLLKKQERQFQNLFQQQMQRHEQLENILKQQQQRINNHLCLMMSQPPLSQNIIGNDTEISPGGTQINTDECAVAKEKYSAFELLQLESANKRLELENLRLEELLSNTKTNYEREIEFLERSYRKQIEVLEQHLSSIENRLKSEVQELQTYFESKIDVLEQEKKTLKKGYEEELFNLKQDHEDDLRKLRKNQEEDLEILKEEHRRMLDNIRQVKMLEFAAVQENGSYLDCLQMASNNLQNLTGGLSELKENMQKKIEILHLEKEKSLEQREKKIEDNERRLKILEESNDAEKQRLMELVSNLELQMTKMTKESAEENWQLRQKLASIDAEKLAFNKEKEFFRQERMRDEERIKDLKEQQLIEIQKLKVQLQEERAQLQVEKTKFELDKRLQNNTDMDKERLEVETAIQVARDAVRKADLERERFYKMQRQLEQQKRDLSDKEHALNAREEELQQELLSYRMAERMAQELQQKSKIAEQFYQNKLKSLQQRTNEIEEKEANLSQERLLLAQDRIALHALKAKLSQQPKCSLCQLSQQNQTIAKSFNGLPSNRNAINTNALNNAPTNCEFLHQTDIVERLLDANIADSLRRMHSNSNLALDWENLLDDDHKKMVQNDEYEITAATHTPQLD